MIDDRIDAVVLLRCAGRNGATRAELNRDVAAAFAGSLSEKAVQGAIAAAIERASEMGLVTERRQRFTLTEPGQAALATWFGAANAAKIAGQKMVWTDLRVGPLTLLALGFANPTAGHLRACETIEGLAGLILQSHLQVTLGRVAAQAALRAHLAVVSLERAFGHRLTADLGRGSHLSAKAGRALAAELLPQPRQFASDAKLVVAMASYLSEATAETAEAMRSAVIKAWAVGIPFKPLSSRQVTTTAAPVPVAAANDMPPLAGPAPAISPPDMAEFSRSVVEAARPVSEGWPGNRKAFISRVWLAIRASRPDWTFSETAFKAMLIEAHRLGHIVLANADLKNKGNIAEIEASAVSYKNSVWHYVRIEN